MCISDVDKWMASNRLQLNAAKTEVLWCASNRQQHLVPSASIFCPRRYSQACKVCSRSGNISGQRHVHEDSPVADCIQLFCSSATDTQHPSFRQSASFTLSRHLVGVVSLSRLDYGSVNLIGIPRRLMEDCLQSVLNAAARLVCNCRKYDHITPMLRDL